MEETKPKRFRRRKVDIESGINKAAKEIIMKKGFSEMKVLDIIKRAKIEPITFYTRYRNMEEFCDSFVREYDYWFNDITKIKKEKLYTKEGYIEIMQRLLNNLKDDSIMAELLRWEVNNSNSVTRRTAMNRELHTLPLVSVYEKIFEGAKIDFVAISALLISGIYYLSLHRKCSTFCGIDMSTEEGRNRVQNAIKGLSDILFDYQNTEATYPRDKSGTIAERMRQRGISEEDIAFFLSE